MEPSAATPSYDGPDRGRHFDLSERRTSDGVVLALAGELDHDSAPALRETLDRLLESSAERVLLDCSQLGFCDSSGLNVLLKARLAAQRSGSDMDLVAVGDQVARVLEITGATSVFTLYPTLDDALAGGRP